MGHPPPRVFSIPADWLEVQVPDVLGVGNKQRPISLTNWDVQTNENVGSPALSPAVLAEGVLGGKWQGSGGMDAHTQDGPLTPGGGGCGL